MHWNKLGLPHVNICKCDTSPAQTHQDVNQQRLCFSILSSWEEELLTKPSSLTLKYPEMFYKQTLGLGTFVWDFGTSSLKTRLLLSWNFYSRAAGLCCYQEKKAQKENPTRTQVYDYSSMACGAILPRKKQHTDENTDNTALRLRWTQMCIWQKYRNIQCHSLVVQK